MSIYYEYDFRTKSVLIRKLDKDSPTEILHKGDEKWEILAPRPDYKDESYCRAIYLGQGCWEDLERITEEEAEEMEIYDNMVAQLAEARKEDPKAAFYPVETDW